MVIEPGRTGESGTQALCCVLQAGCAMPRHSMPLGSGCCLRTPCSPNGPRRQPERYHVSALDALGVLAEALARDGMSRATASTERADLLVQI